MEFDGINFINEDLKRSAQIYEDIAKRVFNQLSTNNSEYVDNYVNMYKTVENLTKTFNLQGLDNVANVTEIFQNDYKDYTKNAYFTDKYKGFSGYVENFVDNGVKVNENYPLIHNISDFIENVNTESTDINRFYKNLSEVIHNVDNSTVNNQSESRSVNINLGGVTQNFTGQNNDDVIDVLVDKLRMAVSGFGDGLYM